MAKFEGFSKFTKSIEQGAKTASKMAGDTMEVTKLKKVIYDNKVKLDELYKEIGKKVYEGHKKSNMEEAILTDICKDIDNINDEIDKANDKILEIKNIKRCPNCGAQLAKDVQFCPDCGTKQGE